MKNAALLRLSQTSLLTLGLAASASAQGEAFALYGTGGGGSSAGDFLELDSTDFAPNELIETTYGRMTGLAFAADGRVWASVRFPFNNLLELDLATGQVVGTVPLKFVGTNPWVSDLAIQPGTGTMFGIGASDFTERGTLHTVDTASGFLTEIGSTGTGSQGGLAFAADGTLYMTPTTSPFSLHTLDPATGAVLSSVLLAAQVAVDGLAVDPTSGALLGCTRMGQILEIEPATGATTVLSDLGPNVSALAFGPVGAKEKVRNSELGEPNLAQLLPGVTSGPVIGEVWDPVLVASPGTTSLIDVLITALGPADLPFLPGPNGVLLCNIFSGPGIADTNFSTPVGGVQQPFAIPFPDQASLVGITLCTQGGYADGTTPGLIHLTNALDITIGAF
ncbi:MAG: WD40 repeat domain-containing protein [Planctomycetota bacterium]